MTEFVTPPTLDPKGQDTNVNQQRSPRVFTGSSQLLVRRFKILMGKMHLYRPECECRVLTPTPWEIMVASQALYTLSHLETV